MAEVSTSLRPVSAAASPSLACPSRLSRSPWTQSAFSVRSSNSAASSSSSSFVAAASSRPLRFTTRQLDAYAPDEFGYGASSESNGPSSSSGSFESVTLLPEPVSAPAIGFGNSSKLFKAQIIRNVMVAAPIIIGALFGNAIVASAAEHSIGSSSLGLKVASFLRGSGLGDEVIVALVACLPALELRGAIPVGYWMKLAPLKTYALAVIGNMLPVPFIALYLDKLFNYVASSSEGGKKLVDIIVTNTRRKAEPIKEFKWLGLMLFVAVPFPGTGAWTGAFAASILGMSFWENISANFVGVLLAGVLVNLVVSVGIREALFVGFALFILSIFMWRILRFLNQKKASDG
ncbi:uncharacterized protein [Physcomitrium patens]|uniref:Small multi-drug export protein n=1 Tax=Physcomitrium patens TaxID=3218 RepID=A0A2K1ILZ6_PHYPA|nr:uncharacterized protein LOC112275084 [Physcomitrium patens]PNR30293.1 hypothetical protein PHYPA_026609 [Physcomitrium patens]|eukprot:XP_024360850.1 uncharacterized protein LOC112275084 [Physcomitrella patens]